MIAVIDYGMGNLKSVMKALYSLKIAAKLEKDPARLTSVRGIILPGVGAFGDAIKNLSDTGLDAAVTAVAQAGTPIMGICLGMQLLMSQSEEGGLFSGLNLIQGKVIKFKNGLKVPQVGWNSVYKTTESPLFKGIEDGSFFYFVHSYYVKPDDVSDVLGITGYGVRFASAVNRNNIWGVQFHPEKSGSAGLQLLKNFGEMCKC